MTTVTPVIAWIRSIRSAGNPPRKKMTVLSTSILKPIYYSTVYLTGVRVSTVTPVRPCLKTEINI